MRTSRLSVSRTVAHRHSLPVCRGTPANGDLTALRPVRASVPNDDTGGRLEADVLAKPGSRVYTVSIRKPLGFVLTERGGRIVVESVAGGGHAAAAGVAAGDVLLATGARAQVSSGPGTLRGQPILLAAAGESFATVAAAIRSNTCSQCAVHLVLERAAAAAEGATGAATVDGGR